MAISIFLFHLTNIDLYPSTFPPLFQPSPWAYLQNWDHWVKGMIIFMFLDGSSQETCLNKGLWCHSKSLWWRMQVVCKWISLQYEGWLGGPSFSCKPYLVAVQYAWSFILAPALHRSALCCSAFSSHLLGQFKHLSWTVYILSSREDSINKFSQSHLHFCHASSEGSFSCLS